MNLQSLKLKASTLCAGGTLLVFGGFLTVNLAGCGGGGGGGLTTVPTPRPVGATFRILQQDGTASRGGSVTLTGNGRTYNGTADNTGVAVISGVAPGNYTVTFTAVNGSGTTLPSTSRSLSITKSGAQNYVLVQGDVGNGPNTITGTIFVNSGNGTGANRACTATSAPLTSSVLISVRDLNDTTGSPIIAQIVRGAQSNGRYTISIPNLSGQRTFRVEVGPADNNGVQIAGVSGTTTFTEGSTTLTSVDVCANLNGVIPAPVETPTPTPSPSGTPPFTIPTNTPTPTPTTDPTNAPQATATARANATATATAAPQATATATAQVAATATAQANATATAVAGGNLGGTSGNTTVSSTAGDTLAGGSTGNSTSGGSNAGGTNGASTVGGTTVSTTSGASTAGGTTVVSTTGLATGRTRR